MLQTDNVPTGTDCAGNEWMQPNTTTPPRFGAGSHSLHWNQRHLLQ